MTNNNKSQQEQKQLQSNQISQPLQLVNNQQVPLNNEDVNGSQDKINFVLRMRNSRKALNDIKFEFLINVDSAEGIAGELVHDGLVSNKDLDIVASSLKILIENRTKENEDKALIFPLVSL